jgi:peptide/nickel transport system ATP-binding protein/oligopeptide transport system ATP-binding protein
MTTETTTTATDGAPTSDVVLEVVDLKKHFQTGGLGAMFGGRRPPIRAVDGVSFQLRTGQNFGLVGESGSGKTTVARTLLRLERPTAGQVLFEGADVHTLRGRGLREFRRATHVVFQDPNASLSPRMKVRDIIGEPLEIQGVSRPAIRERLDEVLQLVGLNPEAAQRYPHEFSGGQRQRIAVARAIASSPRLIVLDEPVSALDVSIRAQILNLLRELQDRLDLTYITIAHDLAVVYQACDVIAVMYLGKIVEIGSPEELYEEPAHPYTRILLASIPRPDPSQRNRERVELTGEIPSPANPPSGCRFHPRCPIAVDECATVEPEWREIRPGRWVACHRAFEGA